MNRAASYWVMRIMIVALAGGGCRLIGQALPTNPPKPPVAVSSGDIGADLVADFYAALLQENPPTREQELALFQPVSNLRGMFVLDKSDELPDIEPMKRTAEYFEKRRRVEEKVAAAGPVVLEYFRKHKDWFLPKQASSPPQISISSTFQPLRSLTELKGRRRNGGGNVMVTYVYDRSHMRSIMFTIVEGRIDVEAIRLGGYEGGKMVMDMINNGELPDSWQN